MKQFTRIFAGAGTVVERGERAAMLADALNKLAPFGPSLSMSDDSRSRFAIISIPEEYYNEATSKYDVALDGAVMTRPVRT